MRLIALISGILILVASVAVPLPALDHNAPFSSHMLRHTTLLLLAAPFLAMAIPSANPMRKLLTNLSRLTGRLPFVAWLAGIVPMWFWHIPAVYNAGSDGAATLISCAPHVVIHEADAFGGIALPHEASLLIAGFIFCWPIITPYPAFRLPPLRSVLYLSSACVACSLLGLFITFAVPGTYKGAGVTDQQTGGLIMWVPCCFIYLTACMWLLIRWLTQKEEIAEHSMIKGSTL